MTEIVNSSASETGTPAVVGTLMQMISGYWVSQIVRTAVDLSIPDYLATESLTAEEIAERESSDPRTTYRLLRACASLGLVAYEGDRRFAGTPMSELLRSGLPNTLRELALAGRPVTLAALGADARGRPQGRYSDRGGAGHRFLLLPG